MQTIAANSQVNSAFTSGFSTLKVAQSGASPNDLSSSSSSVQPVTTDFSPPSSGADNTAIYNRLAQVAKNFSAASSENNNTHADSQDSEFPTVPAKQAGNEALPNAQSSPTHSPASQQPGVTSESSRSSIGLTEQELQEVQKLAARDREVRNHEQAHMAVGGQYAGAAQYSFKKGPDGINYAIGGEVPIDAGAIPGDPEATIRKMEQVRRAALAPAKPSSQDLAVSAQASQTILQARSELGNQQSERVNGQSDRVNEQSERVNEQSERVYEQSERVNGQSGQTSQQSEGSGQDRKDGVRPSAGSAATGLQPTGQEAIKTYNEFAGMGEPVRASETPFRVLDEVV